MGRKYQDLIDRLSLEQKANLTSGKNFWETFNFDDVGIPSIFLSDGPNGIRKQAAAADHLGLNVSLPATCMPSSSTVANSWNVELGEQIGKVMGYEGKQLQIQVQLGPGLNIKRSPLCGRNFEYFSEDPYLAGKMAASYVRGIQSNGIASCIKHYACNNQEINRMTLDSVLDERTMREIYLTGFEIAVKEGGAKCVMSSYNLVNGTYANEHPLLLNKILRDEWGFKGVVVTDWGGENDRVEGLKCHNELEMPGGVGDTAEDIIKAVNDGVLDEAILDDNVDSLLDLIFETRKGALEERGTWDIEEHHAVARKAAEEGAVLLKNDGVLPLKKEDKVAFIGDFLTNPRYQGAGSSIVNPTKLDNSMEAIKEAPFEVVGTCQGFDRYGKKKAKLYNEAIKLAEQADVVVMYLGLDEVTETEGMDRIDMKLHQNQIELLEGIEQLGKKIVVVLSCGSAIELPFVDKINGLLHGYLCGQAGAAAIVDILSGKVNPSGKLSETYPMVLEDVASMDNFPSVTRTIEYREALAVGYRYFDKANVPVRFPFGFGLSYSKFEYADLKVDVKGVSFKIKNVSDIKGKEIAQLYIGLENSKIIRPKKELKGFAKVELDAGEEKEVRIEFDDKSFRYFNTKTDKWEVEEGEYDIYVGASVEDIRLNGKVSKKGTTNDLPYDLRDLPAYAEWHLRNIPDEQFALLLGREIPSGEVPFINKKRNRLVVDYNTTVEELRYSKRWAGRFFAWVIRFIVKASWNMGNKSLSNTLVMGVVHQPMRGLSRMTGGAIHWTQLDGLIMVFNGHFFKGLHHFFKEGRRIKKARKAKEKAAKEAAQKKEQQK